MTEFAIVTTSERPDLDDEIRTVVRGVWPEFMLHDPISAKYRRRAKDCFPRHDVLLLEDGRVAACGWSVALRWDGAIAALPEGYDDALVSAVAGHENGIEPNTLCVMAASVRTDRHGEGLAGRLLTAMRERAAEAGLRRVIVPVRPALKASYPLTPMDQFARWSRGDGLHLDRWIRTHQRLGATILGPAPRSMTVFGTVAQWEDWTAMAFPQTGRYVVPHALDLVEIDRERDQGIYSESNLWMRHL
jgi:GNAT superfamily N-acetyltransferase